ncbi:hypothetical protein [Aquibium sp. ELW1220]|uniref:hypothetical protein n=1 Tax=Aquibium sp. ELW1220 TaxID=2976766 RepID=UPI0025AFF149|nr:hypothetical protein [Aquibium sp. ELW1220]MDN2579191.1 hypothetical protein [Aquibium sp. ELW1220]
MEIDPRNIVMNDAGFAWRSFMVRLPVDAVADHLKEPTIWAKVQKSANALRKHDRLYIVAFDEGWVAEAFVTDADKSRAVLAKPRLTVFSERFDSLFQDENYRVAWMGSGYVVERKSDGHRMTAPVHSAAIAERDLRNIYPQKV